jgi:hypothetical protein
VAGIAASVGERQEKKVRCEEIFTVDMGNECEDNHRHLVVLCFHLTLDFNKPFRRIHDLQTLMISKESKEIPHMKQRITALSLLAALLVVASLAVTALAQDATDTLPAHPRFERMAPHGTNDLATPATPLTTWNGSFVLGGVTYKYNMVGTKPSTGTSTTVPVFIIPIALQYKSGTTTTTFTPATKQSNGASALTNTVNSPIFQNMDWKAGDGVTDLGTTQYEDAFQRGNFWGQVKTATGYHVLLGTPKIAPLQTIVVPSADGSIATEFGVKVGLADINWFDTNLQAIITKFKQIQPNTLPIFMTYDVYLTSGGCCIGGYHSATGSTAALQAYSHFTYIGKPGAFSQDVAALSHEVGEWLDDPLVVNSNGNPVECGILEVGDPEEGFANFGDFPFTLGGFTYNLQDLVYLEYFGAPNTTSVGGELTFHNNPFHLGICSQGG